MKDRDPFEEYFKTQLEQEAGQRIPSIVIREEDDPAEEPDKDEKKKEDPAPEVDMTHRPATPDEGGWDKFKNFIKGGGLAGAGGRKAGLSNPLDYLKNTGLGKKASAMWDSGTGDYAKEVLGNIGKKMFNAYVPFGNWDSMQGKLVEIKGADMVPHIIKNVFQGRIDSDDHRIYASAIAAKNNGVDVTVANYHPGYYQFLTDYASTKGNMLPMHDARQSGWRMKPRYSITGVPDPNPPVPLQGTWGGEHDTLQFALEAIEAWPGGAAPFVHNAIRNPKQKMKLVNYEDPPAPAPAPEAAPGVETPAESIEAAYGQVINEDVTDTKAGDKFNPEAGDVGPTGGEETAPDPGLVPDTPGSSAPVEGGIAEEEEYHGPPSDQPVEDNIFIQTVQQKFYQTGGPYMDPTKRTREAAYEIIRDTVAGTSQTHGGMKIDGQTLGMHELQELAQGVSNDHYILKHSDSRNPENPVVKDFLIRIEDSPEKEISMPETDPRYVAIKDFIEVQAGTTGVNTAEMIKNGNGQIKVLVGRTGADQKSAMLSFAKSPGAAGGATTWKFSLSYPEEVPAVDVGT